MTIERDASMRRQLFAALYRELHRIAARHLRRQGAGLTVSPTTLLHEAYVDLSAGDATFADRARFLAYASRAIRGLAINHGRWRRARKRGRQYEVALDDDERDRLAAVEKGADMAALNDALDVLARLEPRLAQVVDLHFFGGLSFAQIAALSGVSERTVQRDWHKARAFLYASANPDTEALEGEP